MKKKKTYVTLKETTLEETLTYLPEKSLKELFRFKKIVEKKIRNVLLPFEDPNRTTGGINSK